MESRDLGPSDPALSPGHRPPDASQPHPAYSSLTLRSPPNWTAVGFLLMLGGLHLSIAVPSMLKGRWEGYLSLVLGTLFVAASAACWRLCCELAVLPAERRVRLRTGVGRLRYERSVPFSAVRGVRLTLCGGARRSRESLIELLLRHEDITCPPTTIPRQQALFLAMAMGVPLIKVSDEAPGADGEPAAPPSIRIDEVSARTRRI